MRRQEREQWTRSIKWRQNEIIRISIIGANIAIDGISFDVVFVNASTQPIQMMLRCHAIRTIFRGAPFSFEKLIS